MWLVTWEWDGDHAKPDWEVIEALLPWRWGCKKVQEFLEQSYMRQCCSYRERATYTIHPSRNPDKARTADRWDGQVFCGVQPFLFARRARFRLTEQDEPDWKDDPIPDQVRRMWRGELP